MEVFFRKKLDEKGFTLVELMIVVVIIGILASLAVFTLGEQVDKAKENKVEADLRTINSAIELYYADKFEYPDSLADLVGEYLKETPEHPDEDMVYYITTDKKADVKKKNE